MTAYFDSTRRPLHIGLKVGQGGEATVFQISGTADLVAKIYHRPTPAKAAKLRLMLHNVPIDPTRASGHVSIAWPTELVLDANGVVRGFVMPRLDYAVSTPLFNLYHPATRQQRAPGFTWEYLLRTARNLASVVGALHRDGYVVGDLNESNLLVSNTAMVTLVDCDSVQVPQVGTAHVFRCPVGKAEYTPPELQGADFSAVDRRPEHDSFGLAILIFLVLMEGVHPFSGIWKGSGAPPTVEQNISAGNCPYTRPSVMAPPPHALPFAMLPPAVQDLFRRCFGQGLRDAGARPAAEEWQQVLLEAEGHLTRCRRFPQHVYADHLGQCPWCERVQQGLPDPFPSPSTQAPLPPTLIQAAPARPPARTAPPRTATPGLLRRWHTWAVLVLVGLAVTQGPQWLAASGPSSVRPTPTLTSAPIAVAGAQAVGSLKGEVLQQATAGASPPPATVPPAPTATAPPPPTLPPISTPASPTPAPRPVPPQLAARSVGSGSVRAGGSVTFSYELVNPGSVPVDAVLGASIRQEGSDRWISDPANDRAVTVPPGRTTYTR